LIAKLIFYQSNRRVEMANGRNPRSNKRGDKAFNEAFAGIPMAVLYSPVFVALNKVERALLFEFMAQYNGRNNGRLICTKRKLKERGFNSSDVLHRAKKMLIEAGLIFETVQGHRPNWASWYALTWRPLDKSDRYDPGVEDDFRVSGQRRFERVSAHQVHMARESLLRKKPVIPSGREEKSDTRPLNGFVAEFLMPLRGTVSHVIH
jgi:hypothetical protein